MSVLSKKIKSLNEGESFILPMMVKIMNLIVT